MMDKVGLQGNVQVYRLPYGDERRKELIFERHNTVTNYAKRDMLRKCQFGGSWNESGEAYTDAHPFLWVNFIGSPANFCRPITLYNQDSDTQMRCVTTLRVSEGNGNTISALTMGGQSTLGVLGSWVYLGADIDMSSVVTANDTCGMAHQCSIVETLAGVGTAQLLRPSKNYDPEDKDSVPATVRDYRVQRKADGKMYFRMEAGAAHTPDNDANKYLTLYGDRWKKDGTTSPNEYFQLNPLSPSIAKDATFALQVIWIIRFV